MPNSGLTDVEIAQQGATRVGLDPPATIAGDTAEQKVLTSSYETLVRSALGQHDYRWAQVDLQIFPLETKPVNLNWAHAFLLPADSIQERAFLVNGSAAQNHQRYNNHIYANTGEDDNVTLIYTYRVETSFWPPVFTDGIAWLVAALLKIAVQEQAAEGKEIQEVAELMLLKAESADSQGSTQRGANLNTISRVRRGGTRLRSGPR